MIWSFLFMGMMIDLTCRAGICECFEYKQHKSTLKRMNKERSTAAKIFGIYPSKYTHAPCHMRRFKVTRVLNIVLCVLCMLVTSIVKDWPYADVVFGIYAVAFLTPSLIVKITLCGLDRGMHLERSKRP